MGKAQIKIGSQGSDVKELQTILNKNGYNLAVDGIFGKKTQEAVLDYQGKKGLTNNATNNGFKYDGYKESDLVKQAQYALQSQLLKKPGAYESQWQTQLNDIIDKILNREKFSYDLNGDALYQQYKDKFVQQGKLAMGDAIGQASAMTGGYGNSYAQSVGQQAYQNELQNLNDIVPELYQMAYDKYNQEGQDMLNQYAMVGDREEQDYGRYRDTVSDWLTERDYLTDRYDTERDFDYSKYSDDKSYAYQDYRDKIEDAQWQANFDEAKRQFDEKQKAAVVPQQPVTPGGNDDPDDTGVTPTQSKYTTAFINRYMTKSEYLARGHSEKEFNAYMESNIASFLRSGRLTDSEALYLIEYYGLS